MVRLRGLEPLTYRSGICRSIQLSYRRILQLFTREQPATTPPRYGTPRTVRTAGSSGVRDGNRTRNPQIHNLVL